MTRESDEFGIEFICLRKVSFNKLRFPVQPYSAHWRKVFESSAWSIYQRTTDQENNDLLNTFHLS
jgi:hypothetical protein